jgi:pyruvate/2-oxoglutarate dehydrogenase complex dihydrolipoamide acyltransferase (E2) component
MTNGENAGAGKVEENVSSERGYRVVPFTMERRMVASVATIGRQQNNIHGFVEVDVDLPRKLISEHRERTGEKLSFTAYVVACLARAVDDYPRFNAFRKGGKLVILDDVTVSVQVEREHDGVRTPEPLGIRMAQKKTYRQIHEEIRTAQEHTEGEFGGLSGTAWLRFIPSFLFKTFIRLASRNISMMARFGAVGVTAVGMFGPRDQAAWLLPLVSGASVAVAIGGIVERPVLTDGELENHEHLCLTVSFNHDIIDGAPAARFLRTFSEYLKSGQLVLEALQDDPVESRC